MAPPVAGPEARPAISARAALARGAVLLGFWLLLAGPDIVDGFSAGSLPPLISDLLVGLAATATATWVSLRLLPPTGGRLRIGSLLRLSLHFLWQSLVAGVDVARRAFDPRLPLRPGLLVYPLRRTTETGRAAFGAFTSLMPGTLPVGSEADGALVYHCLDLDQPVAAALARDEALVASTRGEESSG